MIVFYIDTTSNYLYTGLVKDNHLLAEVKKCLSKDLSTYTIDEVNKMFLRANIDPNMVDKIIVVNGPGSFTGIRIGVTLAKIYAFLLNKEITTVSSLEAMAESVDVNKIKVPIINARRGACWTAIYDDDKIIMEASYITLEKLKLILYGLNKEYIYISNDAFDFEVLEYNPDILKIVKKYQDRKSINPHLVNPLYLKLTEAEENKIKEE